jgi:hypothetical protein
MTDSELLRAVRAAAADEHDVLGEIARDGTSTVVFLARDLKSRDLVALKLTRGEPDEHGQDQYSVEVVHELDASMPDIESRCSRCGNKLRRWARFCTECGLDVSGVGPSSAENLSRDTLRNAVRVAAQSDYDVLGEMPRAEGGGLVYFAREKKSGSIVALRLQRESESEYALDVTRVLKPVGPQRAGSPRVLVNGPSRPTGEPQVARSPSSPSTPGAPSGEAPPNRLPSAFVGLNGLRQSILGNVNPLVVGSAIVAVAILVVYLLVRAFS